MTDRIGGWVAHGENTGAVTNAGKVAKAGYQHVIYGIDASFSATPGSPVLLTIYDTDVSPNPVLWSGYVLAEFVRTFPAGLCVTPGHGFLAQLAASGSLVGKLNIDGATR